MDEQYAPTEAEMEEMEVMKEDDNEDSIEQNYGITQENMEAYGVPQEEEKVNQHQFIKQSVFNLSNKEAVSFLQPGELGSGLFTVRFLLDMEKISQYYLDEELKKIDDGRNDGTKMPNEISSYFRNKINNICDSGLSNEGFIQKLNVTRKMDTTRTRVKNFEESNRKR